MTSGKERTILGHRVIFTRRRYGHTTYTWASVLINNIWVSLGDPVPSVHWKQSELERAVGYLLQNQYVDLGRTN